MAASEHSAAAEAPGIISEAPGPAAEEVVGFGPPGTLGNGKASLYPQPGCQKDEVG